MHRVNTPPQNWGAFYIVSTDLIITKVHGMGLLEIKPIVYIPKNEAQFLHN